MKILFLIALVLLAVVTWTHFSNATPNTKKPGDWSPGALLAARHAVAVYLESVGMAEADESVVVPDSPARLVEK